MSCFSARAANPTVAEPDPTRHVNYNVGMVLGVDDFTQEFAYLSGRDQWMARDLIGYGTVRGLKVKLENDGSKGPRVEVEPGVAVSPRGQMICVPSAQCAYLRDAIQSRGAEVAKQLGSIPADFVRLYVMLCYRDCPTDKVPIAGEPCRSEDELMAPSRWTDSFHLELSFEKPNQREEEAVRAFVSWLKKVRVDEAAPSTPEKEFLDEIRAAARGWLGSPPASPPDEFMSGTPASRINAEDLCAYTRAALRVWVTELRPKWIARWHGCAATHFDVDDKNEEDCVLLAELIVPIVGASPGTWTVADRPDVVVNEDRRPLVVHLRMLQEWLRCGPTCCDATGGGPGPEPTPSEAELARESLSPYRIVAAGIVGGRAARGSSFNDLRAKRLEDGTFLLSFDGYRPPNKNLQYVVKALPVSPKITDQLSVTFVNFTKLGFVLRLNAAGGVDAEALKEVELMVEVSEHGGGR